MLGYELHGRCFREVFERPELDTELVGDEENGAMMWTDIFEELNSCDNEETAYSGVVDAFRRW